MLLVKTCAERTVCRNVANWTDSTSAGNVVDWFVRTPLQVVIVLVIAVLVSRTVQRVIKRSLGRLARAAGSDHAEVRTELRTRTLSTVLRSVVAGVVWTIAVITVVAQLGINLGAFVATATVIGGAIGFGAQQVVRDFLAGLFVVAEDQFGVGDLVDLGVATGTVERVTLRTARLRDLQGRVWHVPHGNVVRVANLSQGWAQAVLDVPVARSASPDHAIAILTDIALGLLSDEQLAGEILDTPRVLGVQEVLDDRLVLRVIVKTKPAAQFDVTRALRARVIDASNAGLLPIPDHATTMVIRREPNEER